MATPVIQRHGCHCSGWSSSSQILGMGCFRMLEVSCSVIFDWCRRPPPVGFTVNGADAESVRDAGADELNDMYGRNHEIFMTFYHGAQLRSS